MKVENLKKMMDQQEQYCRRNCILSHGLKEKKDERTNDRVLELFTENLNEDVLIVDLNRPHRIGKKETQTSNHVQLL